MNRLFGIVASSILLTGCSFWQVEAPQLVININAAWNINSNIEGIPSPVELKIYQLSDSSAFTASDFLQIFSDDQGTLKAELLLVRQLPSIFPGESRQTIIPLAVNAKYIGIIAGFANYEEAKNKIIFQPVIENKTLVNIEIDGINLSVSEKK